MRSHALGRAIASLARRQHGVFSRAQAVRLGATSRVLEQRLASGAWLRIDVGVYALPGNPGTWLRQCMAATLSEQEAVISGRSAAALHGFPGFRRGGIEITVPKGANHRSRLARVRQSDLVERTRVERIPVVTRAQCVIEIARFRSARQLGRLVDELANRDRRLLPSLHDRYVDLARSRWAGIARVRTMLTARDDGYVPPESELEGMLLDVLTRVPGCPPIVKQAAVPWQHIEAQRVDVLIPAWQAIVECDGRCWHTRVDDFERDRERDNDAVLHGYRTLRFTWRQLNERADDVVDALVQLGRLVDRSGNHPPVRWAAA